MRKSNTLNSNKSSDTKPIQINGTKLTNNDSNQANTFSVGNPVEYFNAQETEKALKTMKGEMKEKMKASPFSTETCFKNNETINSERNSENDRLQFSMDDI
ncbi:MAG: hypothetical protein ACO2ZM_09355 [Francisellaceae bacterium]